MMLILYAESGKYWHMEKYIRVLCISYKNKFKKIVYSAAPRTYIYIKYSFLSSP